MPDALSGMEMIAPSGKFWMAIPAERAIAPAAVRPSLPARTPAYTTPTAIPSGILWSVTAKMSIVVFLRCLLGPSAVSAFMCRCGIM